MSAVLSVIIGNVIGIFLGLLVGEWLMKITKED